MTRDELHKVGKWAADETWAARKEYEKDAEYLACVRDILEDSVFLSMDKFIQHGKTTCMTHCIQVSYLSYRICKARNWDYKSAARAGLLHDLFLYDWHTHAKETGEHFHGYTHPRVAMNNASKYFQISDMEKNMILRHMWPLTPVPPRHKEGYALLYADKICGFSEVASQARDKFLYTLRPRQLG